MIGIGILMLLMGANIVVTLLGFRAFEGSGGDPEDYLFVPYEVHRGRNLKGMILSNFSHANWIHFLLNMYVLFSVALSVLHASNPAGFLVIVLASAVAGDLFVYFRRKNDRSYRALGASGYVTGLLFALVVFAPHVSFGILFVPFLSIPAPIFALLFVGISYYLMKQDHAGISHEGHLGGALGGFVAAILISRNGIWPLVGWFLNLLA